MKLGVDEPKKLIVLGALVLLGGYAAYSNLQSGPSAGRSASLSTPLPQSAAPADASQPARSARPRSRVQSDEFHPVLHSKRPEDRIDPGKIDPTLRLDLLAKVQNADPGGPGRNVFQFGPPPAKALPPEPKIDLPTAPVKTETTAAAPPPPPPDPKINLRYYGYTSVAGTATKTAFFLDGEDILVAKEGDTVKRRYRVVRIGATSVVMEDTQSKHQQTLPLVEELAG
jgi:hypothetical protein